MSKQANSTLIGAFVVGAVFLAVVAVVLFGGGRFFTDRTQYVLFFEGSVHGLNIGAPVAFRGVRIGSVTDIKLVVVDDVVDGGVRIPVYIEIEEGRFTDLRDDLDISESDDLERLINKGLRAQLRVQSMLTGQLFVQVDYVPSSPVNLMGLDPKVGEIPTIPTMVQELGKLLSEYPLEEFLNHIIKAAQGIDKFVNSEDLGQALNNLNEAMSNASMLLKHVDGEVKPLSSTAISTMNEVKKTVRSFDGSVQAALKQLASTLEDLEHSLGRNSDVRYQLLQTLQSVNEAARSMSRLTDALERQPEAILRGRSSRE